MRNRRILAVCLAVVMLVGMMPGTLAQSPYRPDDHTHVWDYSNPEIHYLPTCTENGYEEFFCELCGASIGVSIPATGHTWGEWMVREAPTCDEPGTQIRFCRACQAQEVGVISALGHNWTNGKTIKKATCTQTGKKQVTCSRCGRTSEETIPKTNHSWGSWYVVTEATDWSAGVEERKCAVCGTTQQRAFYPPGTLKEGDRGDSVKWLQEALNAAGYDCGTADGIYGPKTSAAVSAFAEAHGHKGDGIAWPGLQTLLGGGSEGTKDGAAITVGYVSYESTVPAKVGQPIDLEVIARNTGAVALYVEEYKYVDASGNQPSDSEYLENILHGSEGSVALDSFQPGQWYQINYTTYVTEADIAAGQVVREFTVIASLVGFPTEYAEDSDTMIIGFDGNPVPGDEVSLALSGAIAPHEEVNSGEPLGVHLTITNNSTVPVTALTVRMQSQTGSETRDDGVVHTAPASIALMPGGTYDIDVEYIVRDEDISETVALQFVAYGKKTDGSGDVTSNPWGDSFEAGHGFSVHPHLTVSASDTGWQTGYPGGTVEADITLTNSGDVYLVSGYYEVTDADGNSMNDVSSSNYRNGTMHEDEDDFAPGAEIYTTFTTEVTEDDVKAGSVIREYREYAYLQAGADTDEGEITFPDYESGPVWSNTIRLTWPIGEIDESGEDDIHLTLTKGEHAASAVEGEWVDVPLTLTSDGSYPVMVQSGCAYVDGNWYYDSDEVAGPFGGTGDPKDLRPGEYTESKLSFFVTHEDAELGTVTRKVRFIYKEANDESDDLGPWRTNEIEVTLSVEKAPDDGDTVDLFLEAKVPEDLFGYLGAMLNVPMTVTNNGTATVEACYYIDHDADGNPIGEGIDSLSFENSVIGPGGSADITFWVCVRPEDLLHGTIVRTVCVGGYRMIPNLDGSGYNREYADDGSVKGYDSNFVTVEIPIVIGPDFINPYPYLYLTVKQASPEYEKYQDGETVTFNWTLTNLGGADIDYGSVYLDVTNKVRNTGYTVTVDAPETRTVLAAYGGHVDGTFDFQLKKEDAFDGDNMIYLHFGGEGLYPETDEYWMGSNEVPFEFLIDPYEWREPNPTEQVPIFEKWEVSTPSVYPQGYVLGEKVTYGVRITNTVDSGIGDCEVTDPLYTDENGGHVVGKRHEYMMPDEEQVWFFTYEVQPEDVERGWIENTAELTYMDLTIDMFRTIISNTVHVATYEPPTPPVITENDVFVIKNETSDPDNHKFYVEGEFIDYEIIVFNDSDAEIYNVYVYDSLSDTCIGFIPVIAPHSASQAIPFSYQVTYPDCVQTFVVNTAYAHFHDGFGNVLLISSEPVRSPTGIEVIPPVQPPVTPPNKVLKDGLTVTKRETSDPANHSYYQMNETITYEIIVTNSGEVTLNDVIVMDTLQPVDHQEIASCEHLYPGESRKYTYSHTVTATDVSNHWVINYAVGQYKWDGTKIIWSNEVKSPTGDNPEPPEKKIRLPLPTVGDGPCTLTLNGKGAGTGDWTKHVCSEHAPTAKQVDMMVSAAATKDAKEAAWKLGKALWQQELDKMYQALYDAATPGEAQLTILNERLMFYAQLSTYEAELAVAYPDDPDTVAMMAAEAMMLKCTEMCYETHTAPSARLDSYTHEHVILTEADPDAECARAIVTHTDTDTRYIETYSREHANADASVLDMLKDADKLTGDARNTALIRIWKKGTDQWLSALNAITSERYTKASAADKKVISANRNTFAGWIEKRTALLEMIYPDNEEIRTEVVMAAIRDRVVSMCALPGNDARR